MTDFGKTRRSINTVNYAESSDSEEEHENEQMEFLFDDGYESDSSVKSEVEQRPSKRPRTTLQFNSAASTLQPYTTVEIPDIY